MTTVGSGSYQYEVNESWAKLPPRSAGPFNKPTEMVVAPSGDLYVSDGYRNSRVHRFSAQGALLSSWGTPGKQEPGEFHLPHSLWVDPEGFVYVCDRENSRIQVFNGSGKFVSQWRDIHLAEAGGKRLTKYVHKH
jgi:DNA-binding beta-propeller fold protein YncE